MKNKSVDHYVSISLNFNIDLWRALYDTYILLHMLKNIISVTNLLLVWHNKIQIREKLTTHKYNKRYILRLIMMIEGIVHQTYILVNFFQIFNIKLHLDLISNILKNNKYTIVCSNNPKGGPCMIGLHCQK